MYRVLSADVDFNASKVQIARWAIDRSHKKRKKIKGKIFDNLKKKEIIPDTFVSEFLFFELLIINQK